MDDVRADFVELAAALAVLGCANADEPATLERAMRAVEAAKARYGDEYTLDYESPRATEQAQYEAVERVLRAGRAALALRLLDIASSLGNADDWPERDALRAYLAGDDELALALVPPEMGELRIRISDRLRAGAREHRLLASWLCPPLVTEDGERDQDADEDLDTRTLALFRMLRRRMVGPEAAAFERCCAGEVDATGLLRGPRRLAQALCFRNVVERGSQKIMDRVGAVRHAVANDLVAPLRAAIAKMRPRTAASTTEDLDRVLESESMRAARFSACAPPIALPPEAEAVPLGCFVVESELIRVGDPCRGRFQPELDERYQATNGSWRATAFVGTVVGQRGRCRMLLAHHEAHEVQLADARWHEGGAIAVDAGMAGVFDWYHYADEEPVDPSEAQLGHTPWYGLCMRLTTAGSLAGIVPFGAVAASGVGDGFYEVWVAYDLADERDFRVIAVCLRFADR